MIANIRKNIMGTVSFMGKFPGMRKAQDFIVYPMNKPQAYIQIQADTRIARVDLESGAVLLSPPVAGGYTNASHLAKGKIVGNIPAEQMLIIKAQIFATASGHAGSAGVYSDNSGALEVFGQVQA